MLHTHNRKKKLDFLVHLQFLILDSSQAQSVSFDFVDNDFNPTAGDHGTNCAGLAAASRNDGFCGVGAAYDANLGGRCNYIHSTVL